MATAHAATVDRVADSTTAGGWRRWPPRWGSPARIAGRRLALDRSIENMFAADDPILVPYRRLQRTFGEHEVVLAVYADPELKSPEGIERVAKLRDELARGSRRRRGRVAGRSARRRQTSTTTASAPRMREVFAGYTHNRELTAAGVLCLTQRPGVGHADAARDPRRRCERDHPEYPQGALVGEPVLVEEAFDLLDDDGRRLQPGRRCW